MKKIILIVCLLVVPIVCCSCMAPFYAMRQAMENNRYGSSYGEGSGYYDSSDYSYDSSYDSYDEGYDDGYSYGYDKGYNDGQADGGLSGYDDMAMLDSETYTMPTVPVAFEVPDSFEVVPDHELLGENGWQGDSYTATPPYENAILSFSTHRTVQTEAIGDFAAASDEQILAFIAQDIANMESATDQIYTVYDYGLAKIQGTTYGCLRFTCERGGMDEVIYAEQYYTVKNGVWVFFELYSFDENGSPALRQLLRDIISSAYYA